MISFLHKLKNDKSCAWDKYITLGIMVEAFPPTEFHLPTLLMDSSRLLVIDINMFTKKKGGGSCDMGGWNEGSSLRSSKNNWNQNWRDLVKESNQREEISFIF